MSGAERRRVILVGGGHAHLHVAANAGRFRALDADVLLVDPEDFWYSGMAPGVIGDDYDPEASRIDLGRLATRDGFRYVRDRVVGIDPDASSVRLETGEDLPYDLLSLDVGSEVPTAGIEGARTAIAAKPIRGLLWIREFLADPPGPIVVVGGGPTGCELAANLAARLGADDGQAAVVLVADGARLAEALPARAASRLAARLDRAGVDVRLGSRAAAIAPRTTADGRPGTVVTLDDGTVIEGAEAVLATGLVPPGWLAETGLPIGPSGGLVVDGTLRVQGTGRVFAVGDCADFGPRQLPRLGVHAVRQAPVLLDNLVATLAGGGLRSYRPQRRALAILNLGGGTALAVWGGLSWAGRLPMAWKDRIDRRFLETYRA